MPQPGDYILAYLVEKRAVGARFERRRKSWPLHITLAGWFTASHISKTIRALQLAADAEEAFDLNVGSQELFDYEHDIPVRVIVNQAPIKKLHELLFATVRGTGGIFENEQWFGKNYRAHITQHDNATSYGFVQVKDFHLVRLLPENTCEIIDEFKLKGLSNETAT